MFLLPVLTAVHAIDLELTRGTIKKIPVALLNNSPKTSSEEIVNNTITNDLKFSNKVSFIKNDSLSEKMPIDYKAWQVLGANYLIETKVDALENDKLYVTFSLLTPHSKTHTLLQKDYRINHNALKSLSHHISDLIYQYLTGEQGIFSTKLAYVSIDSAVPPRRYTLRISDYDGKNSEVLISSSEPLMSPSWSPNGRELAYVSFENHKAEIYIINIRSGERELLTSFPGINGAPSWAPNGQKLALVLSKGGSPNIYLINRNGSELRKITSGGYIDTEPTFSSDGHYLFFTSNRGGAPQIYKINLENKELTRLTFDGNYNAHPKLSRDNKEVFMMHRRGKRFSIAKQMLNNSELTPLTFNGQSESPSLSPNDRFVIYANKNKKGEQSLQIVSVETLNQHTIHPAGNLIQEPSWSPYLSG